MTAEIRQEIRQEIRHASELAALTRGTGFGRAGGRNSLVERREAAQRRLSSTVRAAELVECALRGFEEALAEHGVVDRDGSLRPTVRALLGLAYGTTDYDVTILPASADVAVRVRHTPFGPEAELVDMAASEGEARTSITAPVPLADTAPAPPISAAPPSAAADEGAADEGAAVVGPQPASPWWTSETPSR
jgi:hypothetical protein